jgi:hypothetical protein
VSTWEDRRQQRRGKGTKPGYLLLFSGVLGGMCLLAGMLCLFQGVLLGWGNPWRCLVPFLLGAACLLSGSSYAGKLIAPEDLFEDRDD